MTRDEHNELAVIDRLYELAVWTSERVARFPRSHKFTLGDRIVGRLYDLLDLLLQAKYARDKLDALRAANLALEQLRFQFRLAKDLRCLSLRQYEFATRGTNEVGRMVGGWARSLDTRQRGTSSQPGSP